MPLDHTVFAKKARLRLQESGPSFRFFRIWQLYLDWRRRPLPPGSSRGCPGAIHEPRRGPGVDGRRLRELSRSRGSRLSGSVAHDRRGVLPVCRRPPRRPADRLEVVTGPERGARADRKARLPGRGWTALAFFCQGKLLRCANICTRKALGHLRGDVGHDQIVYAFVEGRYTSAKRII